MIRLLFTIIAGVLLGGVVHLVSVLALPRIATNDAYSRLASISKLNAVTPLPLADPNNAPMPFMDPAFALAICRYDLSDGSIKLTVPVSQAYTSVSFYTRNDVAYYAINDRSAGKKVIELDLMTEAQHNDLPEDEDITAADRLIIDSPTATGLIVLKALAPEPGLMPQAQARSPHRTARCRQMRRPSRRKRRRRSAERVARSACERGRGHSDQPNMYSPALGRYVQAMTPTCSVLLDLDGTLVICSPAFRQAACAALRALGHEPDETLDLKRIIGPPLEDIMQVLLQPYGDDRIGEAVAAYRRHYGESGFLGSAPYPGIGSSLHEMQQAGLRIYLATSKRETFASRILHHLGFATYFDGIHGSVPGGGLDHKPELLAHILSQHHVLPSHSLMVGDRRHDISGAHAVGMRGLGVLWGYGTRDELETAGAVRLVESSLISLGRFFRWSVGSNLRASRLEACSSRTPYVGGAA